MNKFYFTKGKIKGEIFKIINPNICVDGRLNIYGKFPSIKMFRNSKLVLGDNILLNSDFKFSDTALTNKCKMVIGYNGQIMIGKNTKLNGCSITSYKRIVIGENCQIASNTFIGDTDLHPVSTKERLKQVTGEKYNHEAVRKKDVIIGNNVWIGWGAIILKGTEIGENSIISAGSVVKGKFPDNVIIGGNPARIIRKI